MRKRERDYLKKLEETVEKLQVPDKMQTMSVHYVITTTVFVTL